MCAGALELFGQIDGELRFITSSSFLSRLITGNSAIDCFFLP